MPELPEVETIRNYLRLGVNGQPPILGLEIQNAWLYWERTLATPTAAEFFTKLPGQHIWDIQRRGKFLIIRMQDGALLVHLRMSGDLVARRAGPGETPDKHCRARLGLVNAAGEQFWLDFNDARKFGRLWLVDDPARVIGNLGPEPLSEEFTSRVLLAGLRTKKRALKPLLLDQTFIAGLGNIYTDEALHMARLHPLTPANTLSADQARVLWESIRLVLAQGIQQHGSSIDWVYRGGDFQNHFRVYQRTGRHCPVCGTPIQRMVIGQRGTHFCPTCQVYQGA